MDHWLEIPMHRDVQKWPKKSVPLAIANKITAVKMVFLHPFSIDVLMETAMIFSLFFALISQIFCFFLLDLHTFPREELKPNQKLSVAAESPALESNRRIASQKAVASITARLSRKLDQFYIETFLMTQ